MYSSKSFSRGIEPSCTYEQYDSMFNELRETIKQYRDMACDISLLLSGEKVDRDVLANINWDIIYDRLWDCLNEAERRRASTLDVRVYLETELKWSQSKLLQFCADAYITMMAHSVDAAINSAYFNCREPFFGRHNSLSKLRAKVG